MTEQQSEKIFICDTVRRFDGVVGKVMAVGFSVVQIRWGTDEMLTSYTREELVKYATL